VDASTRERGGVGGLLDIEMRLVTARPHIHVHHHSVEVDPAPHTFARLPVHRRLGRVSNMGFVYLVSARSDFARVVYQARDLANVLHVSTGVSFLRRLSSNVDDWRQEAGWDRRNGHLECLGCLLC